MIAASVKQGWGFFSKNLKLASMLAGLYVVIGLCLLPFQMKMQELAPLEDEIPEIPGGLLAGGIIAYVILFFLNVFIQGGILGSARNYLKSGSAALSDFIASGKKFYGKLLLFTLTLALGVALFWGVIFGIGFLISLAARDNVGVQNGIFLVIAILGGIASFVVLLGLLFAPFAIVAKELGPIASLKHSLQVAKSHISTVILLALFLILVGLAGALAAYVIRLPFSVPSGVVMALLTVAGNLIATVLGMWVVGTVTAVYDKVSGA